MTLLDEITELAFFEYGQTVGNKAYDGSPMVAFEEMRPLQRVAWRRAVEAAVTEYTKRMARPEIPAVLTHWNLHSMVGAQIPHTRDPEVVAWVKAGEKNDGPDAA
jgi:hypothetical protein